MGIKKILTLVLCIFVLGTAAASAAAPLDEYNYCEQYYNGQLCPEQAVTIKGNVYISVESLKKYGETDGLIIDTDVNKLKFYPAEMDMLIGDEYTTGYIRKYAGECYIPLKNIEGKKYISLNVVSQLVKLAYHYDGDVTVRLTDLKSSQKAGEITKADAPAAGALSDGSGSDLTLAKGTRAVITGQSGNFYKIRTYAGESCWILKSDMRMLDDSELESDYIYNYSKKNIPAGKFNMVWVSPNTTGVTALPPEKNGGIDVVAPVWFSQLVEAGGEVRNWGDKGYVELAHQRGFKVWCTINNNMTATGSTNYTTKVFADEALRNRTVAQYLLYACMYDVDGINVDYEDLRTTDGDGMTAFIAELSEYCDRLGLVLSVSTYVPTPDNAQRYQFEELGRLCDYICVMTYDEHYSGSSVPGSVSSQGWYTSQIEKLLESVPAEKILMGVPFYTRIWRVDDAGRKLSVGSYTMISTRTKVEESGAQPVWKPEDGQYYVEYSNADGRFVSWLEDSRSIANRLSYVYYYKLAGTCCWRYGQQEDGILEIFESIYKHGVSPGAYSDPY